MVGFRNWNVNFHIITPVVRVFLIHKFPELTNGLNLAKKKRPFFLVFRTIVEDTCFWYPPTRKWIQLEWFRPFWETTYFRWEIMHKIFILCLGDFTQFGNPELEGLVWHYLFLYSFRSQLQTWRILRIRNYNSVIIEWHFPTYVINWRFPSDVISRHFDFH